MEDIKLWELDGSQATPLGPNNQLESEELLEDTLVKNPNLLIDGLTLVGRQMPTEGGPLDLLGVDGDGRLVVFELKRGTLARDAVAQVIDYASDLDSMSLDALANHIVEGSGAHGIDEIEDFHEWYVNRGFDDLDSLKPLRMFLIGLGADDRTERMVRFLAESSDMDISLLTFHGFDYEGKIILAKQVEVEAAAESDHHTTRRYVSVAERKENLERRIEEYGQSELFGAVRDLFRENWPESSTRPGRFGLSILLKRPAGSGRRVSYSRIDVWTKTVMIIFYSRTKALCLDKFRQPIEDIRYKTWPPNRSPLEDPNSEIQFMLNAEEWETHKEALTALAQSIYKAWQNEGQDNDADSE